MTANLYPEELCPACGAAHALYYRDQTRRPRGAAYRYECPAAGAVVSFRPLGAPESVIIPPAVAIPLTWVSD